MPRRRTNTPQHQHHHHPSSSSSAAAAGPPSALDDAADPSVFLKTLFLRSRPGKGLRDDVYEVREDEKLGEGSNNSVHLARHRASGALVVVRRPLADSDTRHQQQATGEARLMLEAARAGVGPRVHDLWYCAASTAVQRRGLHAVMEHFASDLHDVVFHDAEWLFDHREALCHQIIGVLHALGEREIFCCDVKACNLVLDKARTPPVVRLIDFGRDFCDHCDWATGSSACPRCPHGLDALPAILRLARARGLDRASYRRVLALTMLVLLSANLDHELHARRRRYGMDRDERHARNVLRENVAFVRRARATAGEVVCVKALLRDDEVRACVRHYLGGRGASVRRVFRAANFVADQDEAEEGTGGGGPAGGPAGDEGGGSPARQPAQR
jgi:hypothetical protein